MRVVTNVALVEKFHLYYINGGTNLTHKMVENEIGKQWDCGYNDMPLYLTVC